MAASKIAVLEGAGISKEVAPEGVRAIEAAAWRFGFNLVWEQLDWGCDHHARRMTPEKGLDRTAGHDAIFLGAIERVVASGANFTPDMGDAASTTSLAMAIADAVSIHAKPKVAADG